ncbi:MAG TPA: metallophosphoesterase family protein [Tepidisphaeraceae bacterium]|nr:metallophosphoesterase family protein [Tepidisphaeraceae bacterium]
MIVGLLSDTHGHFDAAKAGVERLLAGGAQVLIHCGDVGGTAIVDLLVGDVPAYFIFGNNDWDRDELATYAGRVGVHCLGVASEVPLDDKLAFVLHGDDLNLKRRALADDRYAYLFQGHTHQRQDAMMGPVRVINPGALYRAAVKTVALLDTSSGTLQSIVVPVAPRQLR